MHLCACMNVCMCVHVCACMRACVRACVCVCVCVHPRKHTIHDKLMENETSSAMTFCGRKMLTPKGLQNYAELSQTLTQLRYPYPERFHNRTEMPLPRAKRLLFEIRPIKTLRKQLRRNTQRGLVTQLKPEHLLKYPHPKPNLTEM